MSVTYHIGCKTCRVELWLGQGEMIYTGEPHTMRALTEFLYEHQCNKMEPTVDHELVFGPEWAFDYWGMDEDNPWESIDVDKYKEKEQS